MLRVLVHSLCQCLKYIYIFLSAYVHCWVWAEAAVTSFFCSNTTCKICSSIECVNTNFSDYSALSLASSPDPQNKSVNEKRSYLTLVFGDLTPMGSSQTSSERYKFVFTAFNRCVVQWISLCVCVFRRGIAPRDAHCDWPQCPERHPGTSAVWNGGKQDKSREHKCWVQLTEQHLQLLITETCTEFTSISFLSELSGHSHVTLLPLYHTSLFLSATFSCVLKVSERLTLPGVALGLAWTPLGGEIMFVEASRMEGEGQLTLTGQLGDVMKESAHLAISWLRANAKTYQLTNSKYTHGYICVYLYSTVHALTSTV